ncbi:MAG: hypothetical protein IKC72_05360 [Clostridia bacterium]|nr:hypothetical protein [Clostridia bacterium]
MVYAAWIGIDAPSRVMKFYQEKGHFDTGFLATDILCDVLFQNGYADVAYQLLSSESHGSFLYMKRHGATTLWENWSGRNSHSHPMFGACTRQIFEGILGIRQPYGSFGYETVTITPTLPCGMTNASGTLETPKGKITVSLHREGDRVVNDITAPEFLTNT